MILKKAQALACAQIVPAKVKFYNTFPTEKNITAPDPSRVRDAAPSPKYFADKKPFLFLKKIRVITL